MDIQIASALCLSSELVWFSRQSFAEEVASLPSDGLDASGRGGNYSGYIPAMQQETVTDDTSALGPATEVEPATSHLLTPPMSPVSPSEPSSTTILPELMVTPSPVQMGSSLEPINISRRQDFTLPPRRVDLAPWQWVALLEAFAADPRQPSIGKLRDLAQQTHLPVSTISRWFARQRRSLRLRRKFGFSFSAPASSDTSTGRRTLKVYTSRRCRRH